MSVPLQKLYPAMFCLLFLVVPILAQDAGYQDLVLANNRFAPDVYKEVAPNEAGNVIFSPLSAETVLALLKSGTKGPTAQQLGRVLHLPNNKDLVQNEAKSLLTDLQSSNQLSFNIANGVFLGENFQIQNTFRNVAIDDFKANVRNVDFSQSVQAAGTINGWVEKETVGTIKNLIDPSSLTAATKLILVNALHFKGNWSAPFNAMDTTKANFFRTATDVAQVETLHVSRKFFNYYECGSLGAQFLELKFRGNDASMVFVLPRDVNGIAALEKHPSIFNTSVQFKSTYLDVSIPKFKFDYRVDFGKVLQNLGATKIFDPSQADLSGIAGQPGDLIVDQVVQKAFIDLNEGGVEAAAATYVGAVASAILDRTPINFNADRPFIFYIKYKGVIAFAGKVTNPVY